MWEGGKYIGPQQIIPAPPGSPRRAAQERQCKLLSSQGSESEWANCPCVMTGQCPFKSPPTA